MNDPRYRAPLLGVFSLLALLLSVAAAAAPAPTCSRTISAHVVALDQPLVVDRMGATIPGGMIFALADDVFPKSVPPQSQTSGNSCLAQPGSCTAGNVVLRDDKRPRPMVLRANEGDCLQIFFTNLLSPQASCFNALGQVQTCSSQSLAQPSTRIASVHVQGMPWVNGPQDDGAFVGQNPTSLVSPGGKATYLLYAEHEGSYLLYSAGDTWKASTNGDGGHLTEGLFGAVNVQPSGSYQTGTQRHGKEWDAQWFRSQVTEQDLCLASADHAFASGVCTRKNPDALPVIDYNAVYPTGHPQAGLPVLSMLCSKAVIKAGATCAENELVHSDLTAVITGPSDAKGQPQAFPDGPANTLPPSLRPIYAYADRRQPYRELTIIYHESFQVAQAFSAAFVTPPPVGSANAPAPGLQAAGDNFGINYGMAGLTAPVLANRLGVGPQGGCTDCKFEEFFLSSWALGDPALVVDNPATNCLNGSGQKVPCPKSTLARFPDDPSNVYHSYMGDHLRFRILHAGADLHHLHHQHAHQWLGTPNSPNGDYLDSQSIGPGSSFTLEMVYYGSGNVNQAVGDSIFHCHFYPHFASGMWSLWRVHDVFEEGTIVDAQGRPVDRKNPTTGRMEYTRALPDGEIVKGTPTPALVPMSTLPMAPMPAAVRLQGSCKNDPTRACFADTDCAGSVCQDLGTRYCVVQGAGTPQEACVSALQPAKAFDPEGPADWDWGQIRGEVSHLRSPGFPFFIPGIGGSRAPHPPLDFAWACSKSGKICTPFEKRLGDFKDLGQTLQKLRAPASGAKGLQASAIKPEDKAAVEEKVEDFRLLSPLAKTGEGECGIDEGVCLPLDGGLPRSVTAIGSTADWTTPNPVLNNTDYSKVIEKATAVALPETGTLIERVAMATHARRLHDTQLPDGRMKGVCSDNRAPCTPADRTQCANPVKATCDLSKHINFVLNGQPPQAGAPYADPCIRFDRLGRRPKDLLTRNYLAVDLQLDAVFNKEGWHFPQQRMISLWGDAFDFLNRTKPPEPLFMRANSNDCMSYTLANLVPNVYELDDFEVRTPTDILGQHIHLVKFDVTSSDGAGNGWNYEDGTFAPNEVTERINAINNVNGLYVPTPGGPPQQIKLAAKPIKFFGPGPNNAWMGAQATVQRWYDDPLYNNFGVCANNLDRKCTLSDQTTTCGGVCDVSAGHCSDNGAVCTASNLTRCKDPFFAACNPDQDRTIRTVFTHDHFGPSTHQQAGLYAGVVAEPKDSTWLDNETGKPFGGFDPATNENFLGRPADHNGVRVRDGGPTSWQAVIKVPADANTKARNQNPSFREFLLEIQDTTLLYQPFTIANNGLNASDLSGGSLGVCAAHPEEPCGFCSYNGVCVSNTTGQLVPSAASPTSCLVVAIGATGSGCPSGSSCRLHLGNLTSCTPRDLTACKSSSTSIASCNFVAGVPSTSWAAGTPINAGNGAGNGGIEAITFNNATNNFSFNYRNEPLYGRTTDPATGRPVSGLFGDMAFAYSSLGICAANPSRTCTQDADCGGSDHCTTRPSPRPRACSASLATSCSSSTACPSGAGTCQPTGFCSDNYALCTAGSPGNVSLCGNPATATCLAAADSFPYPALTSGIQAGDPFTPLLRTYAGDDLHIRTLIGAHINPHNFTLHGMNWLKETSYVDSGWRNSLVMGISEHFESVVRVPSPFKLPDGKRPNQPWADFMYQPGLAALEQASGNWGLLRAYESLQQDLFPLPQNPPPKVGGYPPVAVCPAKAHQRSYRVVALYALQALGGPLVYNDRLGLSDKQAILYFSADDPQLKCTAPGNWSTCTYKGKPEPLVLRAAAGDCIQVTLYNGLSEPACSIGGACPASSLGQACGQNNVGVCGLYPNGQGTCLADQKTVCTPSNFATTCPPDLCLQGTCSISKISCNPAEGKVCKVGCQAPVSGTGVASQQIASQQSVTSLQVGLRPQLVTYDPRFSDGTNGGFNTVQTAGPGGQVSYTWYAGNIDPLASEAERYIPIEFGASNLLPADPMNHYLKGLFAGLIIEPAGSTWPPSFGTTAEITYMPRTGGVSAGPKKFKEFVVFMQDDSNNLRALIANNRFPFNAVNYRSESLQAIPQPGSPERLCAGCQTTQWACMFTEKPFSNSNGSCAPASFLPATPTFEANVGQEVRFRLLHGGGTNTNNVFELYGHNFSEAPYMTLQRNCVPAPITQVRLTASQFIGEENLCGSADFYQNYQSYTGSLWRASLNEWKGSLMGHGPGNHEDVLITSAGGPMKRCGDYLYRSYPADHGGQGIWGIFRVEGCPTGSAAVDSPQPEAPAGQ
jgi:hypothetical protein